MRKTDSTIAGTNGFTLVELLIAMAIFGFVSAAIYATYQNQQDSYLVQEQIVEMQQNLRAGMFFITQDIRTAGYNPTGKAGADSNANNIARIAEFRFARDDNGDGVIQNSEFVRYALTNDGANGINDAARDGIANALPCNLGKETGIPPNNSGLQPVADDVDAIEFYYHLADGTASTSPGTPADIRLIDVSLLVRTGDTIKGTFTYYPPSSACLLGPDGCKGEHANMYFPASNPTHDTTKNKWGPFDDHHRRRILITHIRCRNMGLE